MRNTQKWSSARGARAVRPVAGAAIAAMLVAMGLPLAATTASAAVGAGHIINVFPNRDFVSATGYTPGAHTVNLLRGAFVVGTSSAVANVNGLIEVNHPALIGVSNCWVGVTPDIRIGDVVQIDADSTTTTGVTVTQNATLVGTTVTIKGTAATAGGRIPEAELSARANAKNTKFSAANGGAASIRATSAPKPGEGTIAYDLPLPSTTWTATWTGMDAINTAELDGLTDGARAVQSMSVGIWTSANLSETTNSEVAPAAGNQAGSIAKGPMNPPCTAPAAKGPSRPVMTTASDTGISAVDLITRNQTPTFVGVASLVDASDVNLYVDAPPAPAALPAPSGTAKVGTGGTYSITPTTALAVGTHTITVGEVAVSSGLPVLRGNVDSSIIIDLSMPRTAGVSPRPNAVSSQLANVTANFNELVSGWRDPSVFTLKTAAGVPVAAQVSYNFANRTATLNPRATLAPATRYFATLKGGVLTGANLTSGLGGVAGNPLTGMTWSFITGPRPTVTRKSPAANALRVSRAANVTAGFNENVSGLSPRTFWLKKTSNGKVVAVKVLYNSRTHVVTLNPRSALAGNTRYTATLGSVIKDADGNRITQTSWRFTTRR